MKLNIFFFLLSEVVLSTTTTKQGLFDEALIKPQEPSSRVNLTPLTVLIFFIFIPSILYLSFSNLLISFVI